MAVPQFPATEQHCSNSECKRTFEEFISMQVLLYACIDVKFPTVLLHSYFSQCCFVAGNFCVTKVLRREDCSVTKNITCPAGQVPVTREPYGENYTKQPASEFEQKIATYYAIMSRLSYAPGPHRALPQPKGYAKAKCNRVHLNGAIA